MAKNEENDESIPIIASASFGYDSKNQELVYSKGVKRSLEIGDQEIIIKVGKMTKEEFEKRKQIVEHKEKTDNER